MRFTWTPDLQTQAEQLLDDGASYRETAATIGCAHTTVRDRFPGRGWTMQQRADMSAHRLRMLHANRRILDCDGSRRDPMMLDLNHRGRGICRECRRTYRLDYLGRIPNHGRSAA